MCQHLTVVSEAESESQDLNRILGEGHDASLIATLSVPRIVTAAECWLDSQEQIHKPALIRQLLICEAARPGSRRLPPVPGEGGHSPRLSKPRAARPRPSPG